ncbi:MAG: ATP-binding cassette domain-containing protein [Thermodesulfovibrionales bacterium]
MVIKGSEVSGNFFEGLNFQIQEGDVGIFFFQNRNAGEEFLQLVLGMKRPKTGMLEIMGSNPAEMSRDELMDFRKTIGVVFKEGGLISNLRAWENMVLPSLYHRRLSGYELKERGLRLLDELGFRKEPMSRIAELSAFEKVIIGLARALLLEPYILVFYSALEGLSLSDKESLIKFTSRLKKDRTALLYILHSHEEVALIEKGSPKNCQIFGVPEGVL